MQTIQLLIIALLAFIGSGCQKAPKEVERPEKIVSLREVMYDSATYAKLASLWEKYYAVYPSEDAYANWMYAAHYAQLDSYKSMLDKGVEKYPSNPTLLCLKAESKDAWQDDLESQQLLERAAALDPQFMNPWFALVITYLAHGDREKVDVALNRLLTGRAIDDEIMDFSYNMLASLDTNAILIVNGDNDTYPGWILTRFFTRPDVNLVNRSLLNTEWYASAIVKEGVPPFVTKAEYDTMSRQFADDMAEVKTGKKEFVSMGDRLVVRITEAAQRVGRPVYIACTCDPIPLPQELAANKRQLGLVTLVTSSPKSYADQVQTLFVRWTTEFRTGGLDSWHLLADKDSRAGKILTRNYAHALFALKDFIHAAKPEMQLKMYNWYRHHVAARLPEDLNAKMSHIWGVPGSRR